MTKHDGGPAFPRGHESGSDGMTLRDWFAGQVLPSVVAATSAEQHHPDVPDNPTRADIMLAMAKDAYALADAMLAARGMTDE